MNSTPSTDDPKPSRLGGNAPAHLAAVTSRVSDYIQRAKASSTLKIYKTDWNHFEKWCRSSGHSSLPATPDAVALYASDISGTLKPPTISRHMAAICQEHVNRGLESPTRDIKVRLVMSGIRRQHGLARGSKRALLVDDLKRVAGNLPKEGLLAIRDRALILIGFCGGFRRSELVALDWEDVETTAQGLTITLRRSKTDQFGCGRRVGIPYTTSPNTCPVRSFQRWLEASEITKGPIFRPITKHGKVLPQRLSSHAVATTVKRRAKDVGLDATEFSGHSLRSGLATSAAMKGASERQIMNQTGHRSVTQVRRYIREGSLFRDNVVNTLDL
ncbi:MAG TPA: site-specific integrase [Candidatus Limnocylindrales bacterium]|jgi:integrase|nr:site-specific integrase [Candidatus Limnocylindrales bacterium]